jgi:hypothetical protein
MLNPMDCFLKKQSRQESRMISGCRMEKTLPLAGRLCFVLLCLGRLFPVPLQAGDASPAERLARAKDFHLRAQERTGILLPLYVYPANIHTNESYNRVIDLKRRFESVPFWVIVNPASGPGKDVDANYTKAIDRLYGAGCVILGYVSTSYAKRSEADVQGDIDRWLRLYPRIHGVFFDEMNNADTEAALSHQVNLNRFARKAGLWPTVANPGTDTPQRYFDADAADVIVVHEGDDWPDPVRLKGDYFGGYADYPPFTRAVLVHSVEAFDPRPLQVVRQHARWVYVTDDPYKQNDPHTDNPWDTVSNHLEATCQELSRRDGRPRP